MNHPEQQPREIGENEKEKPILTERQIQVLRLTAAGYTNYQIGQELKIKERTVKNTFSQFKRFSTSSGIFERLGVNNRTAAVVEVISRGIINLETIKLENLEPEGILKELTEQKRKILILVARGYSNRKIGKKLKISLLTVNNHIYGRECPGICKRLNVVCRNAAVVRALQLEIITLDEIYEEK